MTAPNPPELSNIAINRRAVLGAAFGSLAVLGLSACGGGGSSATEGADDRSAGDADSQIGALDGVPVEVWRDPG